MHQSEKELEGIQIIIIVVKILNRNSFNFHRNQTILKTLSNLQFLIISLANCLVEYNNLSEDDNLLLYYFCH